jgi:hypothetical protein
MLINLLVGSITAFVGVFVAVWFVLPGWRSTIEAPKYAIAHWDDDRRSNDSLIYSPAVALHGRDAV